MAEIHVGVGVQQVDQGLTGVATGTDQSNLGRGGVGGVLLTQGRVGVGGSVGAETLDGNGRANSAGSTQNVRGGREGTLLLSRSTAGAKALGQGGGSLVGAVQAVLKVDITEHLAAVLGELLDQLLNLLTLLDTVPEQNLAVTAEATIGLVEEPGQVLVVLLDSPSQLGEVLLDTSEDVVGNVGQPAGLGDGESSHLGDQRVLLRGQDNSKSLHGVIVVGLEVNLIQAVDVAVNDSASIQALAVTNQNILQSLQVLEFSQRGLDVDLVTAANQGTSTGVGEQLLLQVGRVDDRHAGGARQIGQELLHLLDLQAGAVANPPLSHQVVVLLIQVNGGDLLTSVTVEQTTLLSQVDDLQWLQSTGQLTRGHIGVDVQDLTIGGLGHGSQNGETTSSDGRLNGLLVDAIDLTDQVVLGLVEVVGGENTGGQRTSPDTHPLELLHQLHVLLQEQLAGQRQSLTIGNTNSILELGLNTGGLQHPVELWACAVDDDGVETDMVQEGEGGREGLQVLGNNGTTHLDHCELLGRDRGKVRQVLLDLTLRADVAQQLDYSVPG